MSRRTRVLAGVAISISALLAAALAGCGASSESVTTVEGQVSYEDSPIAKGAVIFFPKRGDRPLLPRMKPATTLPSSPPASTKSRSTSASTFRPVGRKATPSRRKHYRFHPNTRLASARHF
jgi:hypothetical protein